MTAETSRSRFGFLRNRAVVTTGVLGIVAVLAAVVVVATGGGSGGQRDARPVSSPTRARTPAKASGSGARAKPAVSSTEPTAVGSPTSIAPPTTAAGPGTGALATCKMPASTAANGGYSLVATVKGAIPHYSAPDGTPEGTVPATWYGGPSVLPVIAQQKGWYKVRLAQRPNGSTTWVRASDVTVARSPYWISVDLATRHVTLFRLSQKLLSAPAGVGSGSDPTPTGQFFVAFFEAAPSAGYGPFIMVTSAHSTSIANWEGSGDAVIGIHGPLGADSTIGMTGAYLSHGCIRLPIPELVQLRKVPAGSPIAICG